MSSENFMSNIELIPYQHEHLSKINFKDIHEGEVPERVKTRALSLVRGDTVLAIFGGFVFSPGVFHLWSFISKDVEKTPIAFYKSTLKALELFQAHEKHRRIQIDIKSGCPGLERWAKAIGFECEGIMRKFHKDGSDCFLYSRTY